jgi:hypothetical protein
MFNLNLLNVLSIREVKTRPPHFLFSKIGDNEFMIDKIKEWINTKLNGRFCLIKTPYVDHDGKYKTSIMVGFEDHKELTFFMLSCPYYRRNT